MRLPCLLLAALVSMSVQASADPRSGEQVYREHCAACHHPSNVMVSSPKAGSARDWAPRLEKGIPGLVRSATEGIGAMPPLGTCIDCTSSEIEAAIHFMTGRQKP